MPIMKKFQSHENEEESRTQQRQRPRTTEARNFSKYDSSGHRKDYYQDENMPLRYEKHSYHVERKPRITSQTFVRSKKNQNFQNCDLEKTRCSVNPTDEHLYLNETNKSPEQSNNGNAYPSSKNQTSKNIIPERNYTRMKFKNEVSSVNDAKGFNARRDCDKISVKEENISKNTDFGIESSLPLNQEHISPSYASNQPSQCCNQQSNTQSNANFHDLCKNSIYSHEERPDFPSDNITSNSSERATFLNDSALYKDIGFIKLKLTDLLYYNVNLMQVYQLSEYASAVKYKILDKIDKFPYPEKEELEFLCEITDGDQSEKNQRIITTRTCHIVRNATEKCPLLLSALETQPPPCPPQVLVYQTVPNLHSITSSYCNGCEPPVVEIARNSEMLTPATNYKVPNYNIAQNDNCVTSKEISESYNIHGSNDYSGNYGVQNSNTNNTSKEISESFHIRSSDNYRGNCEAQNSHTNNSPINLLPIAGGNKDKDSKSFEQCNSPPLLNAGDNERRSVISFNKANSVFCNFELDSLLKYDVNAMHGEMVFDYAFSMKQRILKNINQFMDPFKEKLKFLCEITDGTQLEQNQKLINQRMCDLINPAYEDGTEYEQNQNFSYEQSRNERPKRSY